MGVGVFQIKIGLRWQQKKFDIHFNSVFSTALARCSLAT